MMHDDLEAYI